MKLAKMMTFVLDGVKNSVGKEDNAGYQHFLLFSTMFSSLFTVRHQKTSLCGKGLYRTFKPIEIKELKVWFGFFKGANERNEFFEKIQFDNLKGVLSGK